MPDEQINTTPSVADADARQIIVVSTCAGEARLMLGGELDFACAEAFEEAVRRVCADRPDALLLDLSELAFMDSSGLRVVILAQALCEQQGVELAIIPGMPQVQRLFEVTGFLATMPFRGMEEMP